MGILKDIRDGDRIHWDENYITHTRIAIVTDLVSTTEAARAYEAVTTQGVPVLWELHPVIPFIAVTSIDAEPEAGSTGIWKVILRYGLPGLVSGGGGPPSEEPEAAIIEVGGVLVPGESAFDVDGEQISTSHVFPNEVSEVQNWKVSFPEVVMAVRFRRKEPQSPGFKALAFDNTVNKTSVFGDPPHWWLCMPIQGTSNDGGRTYDVTYEFQRNDRTWNSEIVHTDAEGNPVTNPVEGLGHRFIRMHKETEFRDLALTF